jgi:hypothetical protein
MCEIEQRPEMFNARRKLYEARRRLSAEDHTADNRLAARALYEGAIQTVVDACGEDNDVLYQYAGELHHELLQDRGELFEEHPPANSPLRIMYQALDWPEEVLRFDGPPSFRKRVPG